MSEQPTEQAQADRSGNASAALVVSGDCAASDKARDVPERLLRCVEALLMAADAPLSVDQLVRLLENTESVERAEVRVALDALAAWYEQTAVDLIEVAGGWRFQVGADYASLVARLWEERPPKLSRAMLETLAIICYRQPLARSDIEAVRGVSVSSNIVKTLQEFEWIKVVGHREVPGRPALFATTRKFLDDFGVKRLSDLPALPELKDMDALDAAVARLRQGDESDSAADNADQSSTDTEPELERVEHREPADESRETGSANDRKRA
ncbi:MAG: SMC-Scp complex subunit ScpB [Salinisphaera sp.]|jgi:segregation and condensation protein B|nr:SMC-Scp complex subunit ScpB [Salinisphaera sp.]